METETVLIFAGGNPVRPAVVEDLPPAGLVIAADSGYDTATKLGFSVDILVGDMDSLVDEESVPQGVEVIRHPRAKEATDLELALELALREEPYRVVLVGAEGGRFDHELGAAALIASPTWESIPVIDWVRSDGLVHVIRGSRRVHGDPGGLFSLIPMGGEARGVSITGVLWELNGETLPVGTTRGMSNRFTRNEVLIRVDSGTLLCVVPYPTGP